MMKRRLSTAFLIALLISGGCTFLLSKRLHLHAPVVATEQYVAAAVALPAGQIVQANQLKMVDWPKTIPLTGAFTKVDDVVGRSLMSPVASGEPVLERDLAIPGTGLSVEIPSGMRALSLKSDEVVGVAGFLFPGSHVDVLVTYRSDTSPEPATATVLQDAEVLAAGQHLEPNLDGKPVTVNVVTLLMKLEEAERVVLASTQGTIHFVLRNNQDREQVKQVPVALSQLIPGGIPKAASPAPVLPAAKKKGYVVETVLGNKSSETTF